MSTNPISVSYLALFSSGAKTSTPKSVALKPLIGAAPSMPKLSVCVALAPIWKSSSNKIYLGGIIWMNQLDRTKCVFAGVDLHKNHVAVSTDCFGDKI